MATPKLRFKGFLDPWQPTKIGDFTSSYSGGTPSVDNKSYYVGNIPFIRSAELNSSTTQLHINSDALANSSAKMVRASMILYAIYGNGTSGKVGIARVDGAINQAIMAIDVNGGDDFNNYFLASWLGFNRSAIRRKYVNLGGQKNLSTSVVNDMRINLPSLTEQSKIGSLIAKIDDLIKLQGDKVDTLKQAKKGYLQRIFKNLSESKQRLRFKGFTDDWQRGKLADLVSIKTGKLDANAMDNDGLYDFYTSGVKTYKINEYAFDGDAITIAGNGANVGYMHMASGKFNAYQRTYVLENFKVDRVYLFYAIGVQMQHVIYNNSRNGNIPYIVMDVLGDIKIPFPSKLEQKKIGSFLANMDNGIKLQGGKLERLKELKKGYLQHLFA